ncbi:translation elongation factor G [Thermobaculum terrenum ATCC BAA-798]|uniref:Elongation factor G n=1 Tax=Thermobaculum terrenum (strain ATCC BAA-798 / CCMEE 7001 / YNP1) TaxID=525904 RepID=D1CGA5_THET1|nr:elongation factor G [Thermobaculum terrenum]ACZ41961.1 translation elongation factor G [Thermobaculum terrenum ATCC BAA-798]
MRAYPTSRIRNIGLFSHGGTGKTSLAEALLFASGNSKRLGRVLEGNTISDYDPDEIKRHSSISLSLVPIEYQDHKINLIDTPGYSEFIGDMQCGLRVADTALILVDAHTGIEVGSDLMWSAASSLGLPRVIVVNKMDRENSDFDQVVEQTRSQWGSAATPLFVPIGREQDFRGIASILTEKAYIYKIDTAEFQEVDIPPEVRESFERYKDDLIERIAETSDDLTTKYLEGEPLSADEITNGLKAGILSCSIFPIVPVSALHVIGASQILDFVVDFLPSPDTRSCKVLQDGKEINLQPQSSGELAALVFKTIADPFVGKLSYFRVYSGTIKSDTHVFNPRTGKEERIGQLFFVRGKEQKPTDRIEAGDIGAVAKLAETLTGDTLTSQSKPIQLPKIEFPHPIYTASIRPKTKADLDKMGSALQRMLEEDPTLHVSRDPQTGETLVSGMGESHIELMAERMKRKFGVEVEIGIPRVPYRETITASARAEYKHKKQTGGHGQYGHVILQIEPNPNSEFEFQSTVVGGAVPKQYFPAVEKGVQEAMQEGTVAGYPVVNVKVTLTDGSYHSVDSSEMAFKLAASQAFKRGMSEAKPVLLEPIMEVSIYVPDQFVGDVMSDLNSRRARVEGMDPSGAGFTVIRAQAPLAEMQKYSSQLRSITQGRGTFTMEFSHYEEVPPHLTDQIVQEAKAYREMQNSGHH